MELLSLGAMDITQFCTKMGGLLQIVGYVLTIFKVAIPLIIIGLGMFDFGKAVVAEKEDEIKKQTKRLLMRVVAGIVIFFVPTIILFIFEQVGDYESDKQIAAFDNCETCLLYPTKCKITK